MSGWIIIVLLAVAVMAGIHPLLRRDIGALQFVAATLLVGCAGYALQGSPGMAGAPKAQQPEPERPDTDFMQLRRELFPQFDRSGAALNLSEGMIRIGRSDGAVIMLKKEIDKNPRSLVLWLGLADALVQHSGGMLTPAAYLAFERASEAAPNHPGPRYFYALALARTGQVDRAETYLQVIEAMPEITPTWRDAVARARALIANIRSAVPAEPR